MWEYGVNFLNSFAGAIAFFILFWQLASPSYRHHYPPTLAMAALVTSLRMGTVAVQAHYTISPLVLFCFDLLFYTFWYLAIFGMVQRFTGSHLPRWMAWLCAGLIAAIVVVAALEIAMHRPVTTVYASMPVTWSNLLLAVLGVVLLEQLYRNLSVKARHAIKFFTLGLAALFIYELYLFSQMLVFQTTPADSWNARGAIYSIAGVFLIITLAKTDSEPQISFSRNMVFYTTGLLGAGVLLFLMSTVGYYIKVYGENWGAAFQQVLTFTGIVGLVIISTVPSLRASALVLINKHLFSHKYDYRAEWMKLIDMLSRPYGEDDMQRRAIRAMSAVFSSPGGVLWLRHENRFDAEASYPMHLPADATEPAGSAFIKTMIDREWIFEVDGDYPEDRLIPGWASKVDKLWIIVPLLNEEHLLGFIGLVKGPHSGELTWEDLDLLKTVGRQLASYLARHQAAELLAQSRQFEAYNKLTAFIMHDLKNLIAQQALVVENAAKHKENPAFVDDMITTIENSVKRMNNLLGKIQRKEAVPPKSTDLERALIEVIKKCSDLKPAPTLRLEARGLKARADHDNLVMILSHLIKNAQDATLDSGFIDVRLERRQNLAVIEVEDNGEGMSAEFLKGRLFKPFDTTKSGKGMGIGVYQAREYIKAIGGDMQVSSEPNIGTIICITIPLVASKQEAA